MTNEVPGWITLIVALLALSSAHALADKRAPPAPWTHTRALTPGAATLLAEATEQSAVIRMLVQGFEGTDVVVCLSDSMSGFAGEPRAYLVFLSAAGGLRYLLVRIDPWRTRPGERLVLLGHELEHAHEVAAAPDVRDAAGMAALYRHIGWERGKGRFETLDAQAIGNRIRNEMAGEGRGTSAR
jgi:hypothetical protein